MASNYDYKIVDDRAMQLRIDYNHLEKRLDVFSLAKQLNINLIKYSSLTSSQREKISEIYEKQINEQIDGLSIIKQNKNGEYEFYTIYNDKAPATRIRFTIAHEIKHIVFLEKDPTELEEDMANHFARYILAPPCLLMCYVLAQKHPIDVAFDFDISYEAAGYAFESAQNRIMYGKDKLSSSEEDFMKLFLNNKKNKKA